MATQDFHIHTTFCDGKGTPEEMALSAIEKGLKRIGFSGHSYVDFDTCRMELEDYPKYLAEIRRLAETYASRIEICCGIEQDFDSSASTAGFDYVIGSVHYLFPNHGKEWVSVDSSPEELAAGVEKYYHGDWYAMTDAYYEKVGSVVEKTGADIIGHFDLVTKFNEKHHLFDENDPRYIASWKKAAEKLLRTGKPFEINTGAISRGWKTKPYPGTDALAWLKERGAKLILSSDSHAPDTIAYGFEQFENLLK